jgi:hypothetical protein
MSSTTDAKLLYGIPLAEENDLSYHFDTGCSLEGDVGWMAYSGACVDGIMLIHHCSIAHTMWFAAIDKTEVCAHRGYPEEITGQDLSRNPEWDAKLQAFCNKHNLMAAGKPGWWMASYWG